jgi:polar amino acid transport system substrate-binding protein/glutamate/aspartate transport system substrate-binding protein
MAVAAALLTAGCAAQGIGGADDRLVFGYRSDAPPFSYEAGGDVPAFAGFTAEICNRVAQVLASRPELAGVGRGAVRVTAEDRFQRLEAGDIDVLCGAASITPERQERMGFSIPVLVTGIGVAVAADAGAPGRFAGLAAAPDLLGAVAAAAGEGGARIGYRLGTTSEDWLKASDLASVDGVALRGFADHRAGIAALTGGDIDLYMGDQAILRGLARTQPGIDVSDATLQDETIALATARDAERLRELINGVLADLYRSGEIVPIFERHFGPMTDRDRALYARSAGLAG